MYPELIYSFIQITKKKAKGIFFGLFIFKNENLPNSVNWQNLSGYIWTDMILLPT